MIQRIQTVFLALVTLCSIALYYTSLDVDVFNKHGITAIFSGCIFILSIVSIVSFKNRKRQIMLNNINIFINALLIGLLVYWMLNLSGGISIPEKGIEIVFPIISFVMLVLANVYIRKDENLVKSVDRLR